MCLTISSLAPSSCTLPATPPPAAWPSRAAPTAASWWPPAPTSAQISSRQAAGRLAGRLAGEQGLGGQLLHLMLTWLPPAATALLTAGGSGSSWRHGHAALPQVRNLQHVKCRRAEVSLLPAFSDNPSRLLGSAAGSPSATPGAPTTAAPTTRRILTTLSSIHPCTMSRPRWAAAGSTLPF